MLRVTELREPQRLTGQIIQLAPLNVSVQLFGRTVVQAGSEGSRQATVRKEDIKAMVQESERLKGSKVIPAINQDFKDPPLKKSEPIPLTRGPF